jgi:hypothetical protein
MCLYSINEYLLSRQVPIWYSVLRPFQDIITNSNIFSRFNSIIRNKFYQVKNIIMEYIFVLYYILNFMKKEKKRIISSLMFKYP